MSVKPTVELEPGGRPTDVDRYYAVDFAAFRIILDGCNLFNVDDRDRFRGNLRGHLAFLLRRLQRDTLAGQRRARDGQ
jgi:hypothetical protein